MIQTLRIILFSDRRVKPLQQWLGDITRKLSNAPPDWQQAREKCLAAKEALVQSRCAQTSEIAAALVARSLMLAAEVQDFLKSAALAELREKQKRMAGVGQMKDFIPRTKLALLNYFDTIPQPELKHRSFIGKLAQRQHEIDELREYAPISPEYMRYARREYLAK